MEKERCLVLFGAGAAIDWGGPLTDEITRIVLDSGFYTIDNKTRITQFIYTKLMEEANVSKNEINFETIIGIIEELIIHYAHFDSTSKKQSIHGAIFSARYEKDLLNFSVEGGYPRHGFKLEIPKGVRHEFGKNAYNNETPEEFFFKQLLSEVLTNINARISKYSYHSPNHSVIMTDQNKHLNNLFTSWAKKIIDKNILRMYTLNYDRLFKIIIEETLKDIEIFEGFDSKSAVDYLAELKPNVNRIVNDDNSNICFNLHGSINWEVKPRDETQLAKPHYFLTGGIVLLINSYEIPTAEGDKGKRLYLTNITTGYQKTQRNIFSPFKQMHSTFDRDCINADKIYIIGYSFNDAHINTSLTTAIENNPNAQFVIIEPSFTKNKFDERVVLNILSSAGKAEKLKAKTISENPKVHSFYDGKFIIYEQTFKEYLENQ